MVPANLFELRNGDSLRGFFLIASHGKKLDPASRAPLPGTVYYKGKTTNFKVWEPSYQNVFNTNDLSGVVVLATADVGLYKENLELTFKDIVFDGVEFPGKYYFYKSVDVDAVFTEFVDFINANLSQKGVTALLNLFKREDLFGRFKTAWAAKKMHDAQVGGLMHHELKMLKIAKTIIDNDSRLAQWADLIYLGIVTHDIGKIYELGEGGIYTDNSFVGHRTLAVELLSRNKDIFLAEYNETFFYHILEILTGHHGEYGDKPKTVWAYVIHLIDMLDSQTTGIMDKITNLEVNERNGQPTVWTDGETLTF